MPSWVAIKVISRPGLVVCGMWSVSASVHVSVECRVCLCVVLAATTVRAPPTTQIATRGGALPGHSALAADDDGKETIETAESEKAT